MQRLLPMPLYSVFVSSINQSLMTHRKLTSDGDPCKITILSCTQLKSLSLSALNANSLFWASKIIKFGKNHELCSLYLAVVDVSCGGGVERLCIAQPIQGSSVSKTFLLIFFFRLQNVCSVLMSSMNPTNVH